MAAPPVYRSPLTSRPPYATDDDGPFADPEPQRRYRQPPPPNPNERSSAYNHYESYLDEKDHAYVAPPNQQYQQQQSVPLAAPRPGYAAPIAALNVHKSGSPSPQPTNRVPQTRAPPPAVLAMHPPAPISVPSTPHPLPPTMTPIQPVFARPDKSQSEVKFNTEPIMRGDGEGALIPRRGDKGDDFWRRFSMIAKEESSRKESAWLRKTQSGTTRLSRWVWIVGVLLLACIGLSIGVGVYASKKNPSTHKGPKAIGGSAEHSMDPSAATADSGEAGGTTTPHVTPTHTVARRDFSPVYPTGAAVHVLHIPHTHKSRRRQNHLNRSLEYLD
ncbi:hypothetical protein OF83DRAFT_1121090 [Amylostereum chailletii]|nr:hypothetical protein OF83DRAFT_1121090 [Amylostereum chailletii]